jgi:hypothetical protein
MLLIIASCSSLNVVNVKYADKIDKNYFVYALPTNVLAIDIEVTEVRNIRGPYYAYAEKFMGISGVPKTDNIDYFISNSDISIETEPDSNNYYFIFQKGKNNIKSISLNDKNIILSVNSKNAEYRTSPISKTGLFDVKFFPSNIFTELSKDDYIKEHIDTIYKQVKVDTNWVRLPVQRKTIDTISFEGKAKEAAHHIMRIRKRLFKLLSGAYNKLPETHSVDAIIKELKNEEDEYLSLFIGKTFTRIIHHKFYYTPSQSQENKQVIAYLHPDKGIISEKSVKTLSLILEVKQSNNLSQLDTAINKYKKTLKNQGLVYRIPELANIKLSLGNTLLVEKNLPLAQFGILNSLPVKHSIYKNSVIEFDSQTGNIRKIE